MGIYQIGEVIRRAREHAGISQQQLCEGICSPETMSRIENGRQVPNRANFQALMERLGKCGEKYMPFIRCGEIEDLVEARRIELLIGSRRYEEAEEALEAFERRIDSDDNVNRQYLIRFRSTVEQRLGKITLEDRRERLKDALQCTLTGYKDDELPIGILSRQEIGIFCNIAVTYVEEKEYDKAIHILRQIEKYFERTWVDLEERSWSELLMLSNLGQCLGLKGDTLEAKEVDIRAVKLGLEAEKRGHLPSLLYNAAFEMELLGEDQDKTLEMMIQAYYAAELGQDEIYMEHIKKHIENTYGNVSI